MIRAISWCSQEDSGVVSANPAHNLGPTASPYESESLVNLVGRPIKYLSRMNTPIRKSLAAAALAARSLSPGENTRIGLLAGGYELTLIADCDYFQDYLSGGRSMGRGNLFIYTLPTSALGEIAIALSLGGPSLHIDNTDEQHSNPLPMLLEQARQMISDGEAQAMLLLWCDAKCALAAAVTNEQTLGLELPSGEQPLEIANQLRSCLNRL